MQFTVEIKPLDMTVKDNLLEFVQAAMPSLELEQWQRHVLRQLHKTFALDLSPHTELWHSIVKPCYAWGEQ